MLGKVWRDWDSHALIMGPLQGAVTLENYLAISFFFYFFPFYFLLFKVIFNLNLFILIGG